MIELKDLCVAVDGKSILENINLQFSIGKNYGILGKNGSGKSSMALTIMGHPKYEITGGDILINGESIKEKKAENRAKLGIFLAFQNIPEIKGLKLFEFLRSIYSSKIGENVSFISFKQTIVPILKSLEIDQDFLWRDLNVGFSGGEKRKLEAVQIKLLEPKFIFLDEIDSGLDIDSEKKILGFFKELNNSQNSFIVITHKFDIINYLNVDNVYVLEKGKIKEEGSIEIIEKIENHGFDF